MEERILVVDDDIDLTEMIRIKLECQGFTVLTANNGRDALRLAYENHPDLVILDIMLPQMDGFEICERLRELTDVPVIIMSARTANEDMVRGFRIGADNYLTKPVSLSILVEHIYAILKRTKARKPDLLIYEDNELRVDLTHQTVQRNGKVVNLSPTEFRLLSYLVSQKDCVVSQEELLSEVWGPNYEEAVTNLAVYIHYLRDKLGDNGNVHRYIRNRWGIGYWFATKSPEQESA